MSKLVFDRSFTVVIPQRDEWMDGRVARELNTIELYTDGSLMNEKASSAFYCSEPSMEASLR